MNRLTIFLATYLQSAVPCYSNFQLFLVQYSAGGEGWKKKKKKKTGEKLRSQEVISTGRNAVVFD